MKKRERGGDRDGGWPPSPEPLSVPVADSHTHIDLQKMPVNEALARAADVGVKRLVQVGVDLESSRWGVEAARQHGGADKALVATVALHPNEAPLVVDLSAQLREIDALAADSHVVGIGETGMDFFRTEGDALKAQEESFRAHIQIAKSRNKTLMIHDRDAHNDVLRVLREEGTPDRVIMHCFSGDVRFASQCADAGYFMSFAGNVTFKSATSLREAVSVVPAELLLVETDGPFLTPEPYRGRPNSSYLIPITVRFLVQQRSEDLDDFSATLWRNTERAFGL